MGPSGDHFPTKKDNKKWDDESVRSSKSKSSKTSIYKLQKKMKKSFATLSNKIIIRLQDRFEQLRAEQSNVWMR